VQYVVTTTMLRRNVLRACVAARYANGLPLTSGQDEQNRAQLRSAQNWLLECRGEITHEDPALAVLVGLSLTLPSLQAVLLFEQLPPTLPTETLARQAERLLISYLTGAGASACFRYPTRVPNAFSRCDQSCV